MRRTNLPTLELLSSPLRTRRALLLAGPALLLSGCTSVAPRTPQPTPPARTDETIASVRDKVGGRIGVYALDTHSGREVALDDDARFAMASTFKLLLAGAVLAQVDSRALTLEQTVRVARSDLVSYSPVTSKYVAQGSMTVQELCAAIIELSDNAAANLLLSLIGGPAGFTRFVRGLGDPVTRLDRIETALNSNVPGDPRDTTTPRAMVGSMQQLLTGEALSEASRALLAQWLVSSRTGAERIRAGLPGEWRVGDKTGTGANGAVNDVAIAWPPQRRPIFIAVYMSGSRMRVGVLNAAHAVIAGLVVRELTA